MPEHRVIVYDPQQLPQPSLSNEFSSDHLDNSIFNKCYDEGLFRDITGRSIYCNRALTQGETEEAMTLDLYGPELEALVRIVAERSLLSGSSTLETQNDMLSNLPPTGA